MHHYEIILEISSLLWQKWWLLIYFKLTLNLLCVSVVVFNDSFNTRDRGYITFTPSLSAVHLPLIKHLALGSASIHFTTQASIPVLTALMCHCWLHLSVTAGKRPAVTLLHSRQPRVLIHWHHVHLLPRFGLIPSGPNRRSCWKKLTLYHRAGEVAANYIIAGPFWQTLTIRDLEATNVIEC